MKINMNITGATVGSSVIDKPLAKDVGHVSKVVGIPDSWGAPSSPTHTGGNAGFVAPDYEVWTC